MVKIVDFAEDFCWKRKIFKYKEKTFMLLAGDTTAKELWESGGFLVAGDYFYSIPQKLGVFAVLDSIFFVSERGIFFEII